MSTPISNDQSAFIPFRQPQTPLSENNTFRQTAALGQQSTISMRTKEGDTVTISAASLIAGSKTTESFGSIFANKMTASSKEMTADSLEFTVSGDLNEEELRDIHRLFTELTAIAEDFFAGDINAAMTGAAALGDMGTVSQLAADFTRTSIISSQWTGSHPMPEEIPRSLTADASLLPPADTQESLLAAQWRQIERYLDEQALLAATEHKEAAKETKPERPQDIADLFSRMQEEMRQTMADHPRLSPFMVPLADKALAAAGNDNNDGHLIDSNLIDRLNSWMFTG